MNTHGNFAYTKLTYVPRGESFELWAPTSTQVPRVYVGFSLSHTSKSSVGGSVGSSKGFLAVLKTMWDNVGVEGAIFDKFQAGGEREQRLLGFECAGCEMQMF